VAELAAKGLAPATVVKAYNILSKMMSGAVDAGLIVQSPCRNIKLPKVEQDEMRFLTPDGVAGLADAMDPRYRGLVLLGAYGGLRFGEMCGLRVQRVHLLAAEVEVLENITEVRGVLDYGSTKTRAGRRRVPIPRLVADTLAVQIELRPDKDCDLVFQAPEGGPIRRSHWRQRFWVPATQAAGFEGLRLHDLRHTAVALWIAAGRHAKEIATWAGHTSAGFVLDRYGHVFPTSEEGLRMALDEMIRSATPAPAGRLVELPR
jgi:integrase